MHNNTITSGIKKRILSFTLALLLAMNSIFFVSPQAASANCGFGNNKLSAATRPGGVALNKTAQFLEGFENITGAAYNENTGRLVFMGNKNTDLIQEINKDDLAVVIRAIYADTYPTVSIDPNPSNNNQMLVRFTGNVENTNVGKVLYEADRTLKILSLGKDNVTGQPVNPGVPGYKSLIDRYAGKLDPTPANGISRMWLEPKIIEVKKSANTDSFVFGQTAMELRYENMGTPDPEFNQANQDFINHFNQHYQEFAQVYPVLQQANEIAKLVGIVRWIKENNIPLDLMWLLQYQITPISTPSTIPAIAVSADYEVNNTRFTISISGGVALNIPNVYKNDQGEADLWRGEAISQQPAEDDPNWSFTHQGDPTYLAVAVSLQRTKKNGAYVTKKTDFSIPARGDIPLSLTRYYSSFETKDGPLGYGWSFIPKELYFPNPNDVYHGVIAGQQGAYPNNINLFDNERGELQEFKLFSNGYFNDEIDEGYKLLKNSDGTYTLIEKERTKYNFDNSGRLQSIVDKNGNATVLTWVSGKMISITDPAGRSISLTYNGNRIDYVTGPAGRVVDYNYDAQGNLKSVTNPRGDKRTYDYDSDHRITRVTDSKGIVEIQNTYDLFGRMLRHTDAKGNYFDTAYNIYTVIENPPGTKKLVWKGETRTTDNFGYVNIEKYDKEWRLQEAVDPLGYRTTYTYDSKNIHKPASVTDKRGNTTKFEYDAFGNMTKSIDALESTTTYYYYHWDLISTVNPKGSVTSYYYDANKNLTQTQKGYTNNNTYYTYDQYGNLKSVKDALNRITSYEHDSYGNPVIIKDGRGNSTSQEYDILSRQLKVTNPEGRTMSFTYDASDNLLTRTNAAGITKYGYDKNNNLIKIVDAKGGVSKYSYDEKNNLTGATDALGQTTSYSYDSYDNLTAITDANGNSANFEFNPAWRKKFTAARTPLNKTTTYTYDENGNIITRIDPDNQLTTYTYGPLNRLTKVTYPNAASITYEYDALGHKTKMTDTVGNTTYEYEPYLGFLIKATDPDSDTVQYAYDFLGNKRMMTYPDGKSAWFRYNENNQLAGVLDFNGYETLYTYDKVGNVANQTYPNGASAQYAYDSAGRLASLVNKNPNGTIMSNFNYNLDQAGNRTKITQDTAAKRYYYDSINRLYNESYSNGNGRYVYDAVGNRKENRLQYTLPNADFEAINSQNEPEHWRKYGSANTMSIDNSGLGYMGTASVKFNSSTTTAGGYWNNESSVNVQSVTGKSIVFSSKIKTINMSGTGAYPLIDFWDSSGNWVAGYRPTQTKTGTNDWGELGAIVTIPANAKWATISVEADGSGTALFDEPKMYYPSWYWYNQDDQLTSQNDADGQTNYAYDNNGNMITGVFGSHTLNYNYDYENRLTNISDTSNTAVYTYDGEGKRIKKQVNTSSYKYIYDVVTPDGLPRIIGEKNLTTGELYKFLWGDSQIIGQYAPNGNSAFHHHDALGTTRHLSGMWTNPDGSVGGEVATTYKYDTFGRIYSPIKTPGYDYNTTFLFTGEQYDSESTFNSGKGGFYYLRARFYDPYTGRFIQRDKLLGNTSDPQSLNRYAYVGNNPVNLVDPSGHNAEVLSALWGGAIAEPTPVGEIIAVIATVGILGYDAYIYFSKGGKQRIRDSRWIDVSDAEWPTKRNELSEKAKTTGNKQLKKDVKKEDKARRRRRSRQCK